MRVTSFSSCSGTVPTGTPISLWALCGPRRRMLRINRFRIYAKALSLRCSSSPQKICDFSWAPVLRQSARFRLSEGLGGIFTVTVQVFNCQDRSDQKRSLHQVRNERYCLLRYVFSFFASHYSREFFRRLFKNNQDCLQIVYKEALYRFPPLNKELGALFFYPHFCFS